MEHAIDCGVLCVGERQFGRLWLLACRQLELACTRHGDIGGHDGREFVAVVCIGDVSKVKSRVHVHEKSPKDAALSAVPKLRMAASYESQTTDTQDLPAYRARDIANSSRPRTTIPGRLPHPAVHASPRVLYSQAQHIRDHGQQDSVLVRLRYVCAYSRHQARHSMFVDSNGR